MVTVTAAAWATPSKAVKSETWNIVNVMNMRYGFSHSWHSTWCTHSKAMAPVCRLSDDRARSRRTAILEKHLSCHRICCNTEKMQMCKRNGRWRPLDVSIWRITRLKMIYEVNSLIACEWLRKLNWKSTFRRWIIRRKKLRMENNSRVNGSIEFAVYAFFRAFFACTPTAKR